MPSRAGSPRPVSDRGGPTRQTLGSRGDRWGVGGPSPDPTPRGSSVPPRHLPGYDAYRATTLTGRAVSPSTSGDLLPGPGLGRLVVAGVGRGHPARRVQPGQDGVADLGELVDLLVAERVDDVVPDVGDVAGGCLLDLRPARLREPGVGRPAVLGTGEAFHQAPGLQAVHHVGDPGQA